MKFNIQVEYDFYEDSCKEDLNKEIKGRVIKQVAYDVTQNLGKGYFDTVSEAAKEIKKEIATQIVDILAEQFDTTKLEDRVLDKIVKKLQKQSTDELSDMIVKQSMKQINKEIKNVAKLEADRIRSAMLGGLK